MRVPSSAPARLPAALALALACSGDDQTGESASATAVTTVSTSGSATQTSLTTGNSESDATGPTSAGSDSESASGSTGPTTSDSTTASTTASTTSSTTSSTTEPTSTTAVTATTDATTEATTDPTTTGTTGEPIDVCKVNEDMMMGECSEVAPPDAFEPEIQWAWTNPGPEKFSIVTPLVANLTDDDQNGEIDLCDVPDVVVVASTSSGAPNNPGHIYILDGATGTLHFQIADPVDHTVTPAIGDIDGDGLPEIVAAVVGGAPVAFEHDGTKKWQSATGWPAAYSGAIALADLDNDGDVEIIAGNQLYDHNGTHLWTAPQPAGNWSASAAADLDADGDLEVVLGHAAYRYDGSQYYLAAGVGAGYPSIADLDDDGLPEVLVNNQNGLTLLEHDGAIKYKDLRPTGDPVGFTTWLRPSTVHDFDGDEKAEYAVSSANNYTVYEGTASIVWKASVSDQSGIAAGTAFDFLGDGIAEAMYADENFMFVFNGAGQVLLQIPRTSGTLSEYPIVADIDNDGSAEIVVVSCQFQGNPSPTVQVIRDKEDRWIQARRIWNQHTYHVTNVREDSTIPQFEKPSWKFLNTFRTNAQIESGGVCQPIPQ